jgi:hypothetical protein
LTEEVGFPGADRKMKNENGNKSLKQLSDSEYMGTALNSLDFFLRLVVAFITNTTNTDP